MEVGILELSHVPLFLSLFAAYFIVSPYLCAHFFLACTEGGCGACTVMVSRWDEATNSVKHRSVNACLYPLCAVDGT